MEENNEKRALKLMLAMQVMQEQTLKTVEALATVSEKMHVDINDLSLVYFSDCLETQIAVASKMGVKVELDGFFDAMKEKINHDIENWHPKFDVDKLMELFACE